jgi:pyruvate/2-oxoglutarate/acetoin dehydrogenase E1 component
VHRALEAAQAFETEGISAGVLDLRTVSPLDKTAVREAVAQTGRLLMVDEDYEGFGLSGELSAVVLEAGLSCKYTRVCTQTTIPYARHLEDQILERVNNFETLARRIYCSNSSLFAGLGGLIQAASGSLGGTGIFFTNLSGCAS